MAPTPSPKPPSSLQTPSRTPQSKHRLHFQAVPTEHPVEVVGRIRDHPDPKISALSPLEVSADTRTIRVRTDIGYRDFSLDGASLSESEPLDEFYARFVAERIRGVRMGSKCTVMMYGPTGSGKSHTMFGCAKQPGIVYRALKDILGDEGEEIGMFVQVAVLEIYNEEIYDLLSGNSNPGVGLPKPNSTPKVRLEVMGKKAKNAAFISGNEAGKISREVAKVEKRRIVKSTNCNERSSRSHCMIILDVPSVGGRLMLVDMAGSENIDQAGQTGFEAKMQTAKINQGNIALKRVVESIANGDSHVPFRDSKLTMLLQDSFEDDKSKILMILCASPDPREMHKTISTLEYGAKAKCIVRAAHMPTPKEKGISEDSSALLKSRLEAMNQFIYKLQMDNKIKEKERDEAHQELLRKEEEIFELKSKVKAIEGRGSAIKEQELNSKVDERTQILQHELMKMEEKMQKQQEELGMLRQRLEEMESNRIKASEQALQDIDGGRFVKRLTEMYAVDQGMEKSMELDMGDQQNSHDVREIQEDVHLSEQTYLSCHPFSSEEEDTDVNVTRLPNRVCLSTVLEADEEGEERESFEGYEVDKEVVEEEYTGNYMSKANDLESNVTIPYCRIGDYKDSVSARKTRIQNIFRLCGNYRELTKQVSGQTPPKKMSDDEHKELNMRSTESPVSALLAPLSSLSLDEQKTADAQLVKKCTFSPLKENCESEEGTTDVFVKWEASKELTGNFIRKLKVPNNSTLSQLRKQIETHLEEDNKNQSFTFLLLGDPSGAPVAKEKEETTQVGKLPLCNSQLNSYLACLRPIKTTPQRPKHVPFASLENTIPFAGCV